jgi:beta-xylosidase
LKVHAGAPQAARVRSLEWTCGAAAALLITACARDARNALDAGATDAANADAASPDANAVDSGEPDANGTDAGAPDAGAGAACPPGSGGNPFVDGWYADPDMKVYGGRYWVYPTYSAPYEQQTFLDAFSSPDLVHWTRHPRVLDTSTVTWATRAIWAPSPIERDGTYFLYFGANDIQSNGQVGGIGVATAARPDGPFVDAIGQPLIGSFQNGAQPIDQNVFIDDDGQAYLYYGGHRHCNVAKLNRDMTSLGRFDDGTTFKEITPTGYVEGALMFKRNGTYYFMWSEGGWTGPDYRVSYAMASSPLGPFTRLGTILGQDAAVATGSGHNTVVNVPGTWTTLLWPEPRAIAASWAKMVPRGTKGPSGESAMA